MNITITKRDGTREPFNADRINRSIERACRGLTDPVSMVTQIASETQLTLYDGMTTEEMDRATIDAAVQNISHDIEYDKVATRLLLKTIYRKVIGDYDLDSNLDLRQKHRDRFAPHVEQWVEEGLLDPRMRDKFDLNVLADTLDIDRDNIFVYAGLSTLSDRYSLKNRDGSIGETPQYFFMRVAMGLSYNEENPTEMAKKFYNKLSRHEYIAGGSTNVGAGTNNPALANCFLIQVEDDMAHIAKSVSDVMIISKATGGIGVSVTKLRATGSVLSSTNTKSSGPTPFAKIMDTAIRAIVRGGKKMGALCFYMENWHYDFPEFIDWKHNAGDDYMRMRTANTAAYISDEFMKRVHQGDTWYLFDPKEVADLIELYGSAFSKRYQEYCEKAERGEMKMWKKMPARELFRKMLISLQTTSHPWLTWKDTVNLRALNNNTGTIHMSNLCTEICLPQDKDNIAVCNLASINLAAHITHREINWPRLEETVRTAVRHLDNLIDINALPIKEASNSDVNNRAVGLGVMGFTDTLEQLGMAYDSEHAWDFADRIFEFISYMAIDESANLAKVRGSYKNYEGSGWSKGMVPIDTLEHLEADRKVVVSVAKDSKHKGLDWNVLRAKVKSGMRNATLMAVAPNANIGLVAGTTPGMDPRFAQIFSRNKFSGKYVDINHNLVKDLKNLGIWDTVRDQVLANRGDISEIDEIPHHIRDVYKTSFGTSPYAFIEVAARANKWIDQAISRNMYLETRDIDETMKIYSTAWGKGLKTTYYLHMKPRHSAEQSTIKVNKGENIGRIGFGGLVSAQAVDSEKEEDKKPTPSPFSTITAETKEMPIVAIIEEDKTVEVSGKGFGAVIETRDTQVMEAKVVEKLADPIAVASVGFKGFGGVQPQAPVAQVAAQETTQSTPQHVEKKPEEIINKGNAVQVCPIDPAERAQCDSCQ
ncbi:MAG: ribonucleoside-diphosphate reductase subunit alpha [Candidatus Zambryskibacteria bacterium CG10_big_fil_rev_8_21_14_0_10_42_12]|uniref:Ribonucleoside-diphosphate reductase n=1 Tax=Candidatus Zambryskibacteria bacterium CG10_big_fil_rev_8_21_14_0_10_42_12 TaxID=1975115 RepID=A0A2H0QUN2_9BACT|nr:MAG: ribonucleoside-diphosphate reductase subunit alpha [Candidatus Zambryskibacteria bacterium CG10_big_fil_rev_8_21_14_0_10_42_12]